MPTVVNVIFNRLVVLYARTDTRKIKAGTLVSCRQDGLIFRPSAVGAKPGPRSTSIILLTRKSFAAWKESFFADFFALFASWR